MSAVAQCLRQHTWSWRDETDLHDLIEETLRAAGFASIEREVRLSDRDRIDFVVDRVGIEVKVASSSETVYRQLRRYAEHRNVLTDLVLFTTRAQHCQLAGIAFGDIELEVVTARWV